MNLAFERGVPDHQPPMGPSVSVPETHDGGTNGPGDERSSSRAPGLVAVLLPSLDPPASPSSGECTLPRASGLAPAIGHHRLLDRPPIPS